MLERLQKIIANQGICSRRKAEELIKAGKVFVNDKKAEIGQKADPTKDEIRIGSRAISSAGPATTIVYAFNKPRGITSTTRDFKGEKNILSFFPKKQRLYPAGRLDKDSRGLMIVTNDGELANKITHPRFKSEKEYHVTLDRPLDELSLHRLRRGIKYEGVQYKTISVRELTKKKLRIVLGEGKKRHIRMMLRACKYQIRDLVRVRINDLELGTLESGKYRRLSDSNIEKLLS